MMKVNVIFAGLHKDNIDMVLKRMEAMTCALGADLQIHALNVGEAQYQEALKIWLSHYGGSRLFQAESEGHKFSWMLSLADTFLEEFSGDLTLVAPTNTGMRLGQRLAAGRKLPCLVDTLSLEYIDGSLYAARKIYSTHMDGLFPAKGTVVLVSQSGDKSDFRERAVCSEPEVLVYEKNIEEKETSYLLKEEVLPQVEDLSKAKVVFLGGKGLGNKANFERMEVLAKKLGAFCGCTRAAALAGWTSYDKVVGISGWKLQGDICIAFGVSGAGPLLQGLEDVGRLTAINNDAKAPIFRHADYGVVVDCIKILEAMEAI